MFACNFRLFGAIVIASVSREYMKILIFGKQKRPLFLLILHYFVDKQEIYVCQEDITQSL